MDSKRNFRKRISEYKKRFSSEDEKKRYYTLDQIQEGWIEYENGDRFYYKKGKENNLPTVFYHKYAENLRSSHFPSLDFLKLYGIKFVSAYPFYIDMYRDERETVYTSEYRFTINTHEIHQAFQDAYNHYMYWDPEHEEWIKKTAPIFKKISLTTYEKIDGELYTGHAPSEEMIKKAIEIGEKKQIVNSRFSLMWPDNISEVNR